MASSGQNPSGKMFQTTTFQDVINKEIETCIHQKITYAQIFLLHYSLTSTCWCCPVPSSVSPSRVEQIHLLAQRVSEERMKHVEIFGERATWFFELYVKNHFHTNLKKRCEDVSWSEHDLLFGCVLHNVMDVVNSKYEDLVRSFFHTSASSMCLPDERQMTPEEQVNRFLGAQNMEPSSVLPKPSSLSFEESRLFFEQVSGYKSLARSFLSSTQGSVFPGQVSGHVLPRQESGHVLPRQRSGHVLPRQGSGHVLPEETSVFPGEGSGHVLPRQGSGHVLPEETSVQQRQGSGHVLPEETSVQQRQGSGHVLPKETSVYPGQRSGRVLSPDAPGYVPSAREAFLVCAPDDSELLDNCDDSGESIVCVEDHFSCSEEDVNLVDFEVVENKKGPTCHIVPAQASVSSAKASVPSANQEPVAPDMSTSSPQEKTVAPDMSTSSPQEKTVVPDMSRSSPRKTPFPPDMPRSSPGKKTVPPDMPRFPPCVLTQTCDTTQSSPQEKTVAPDMSPSSPQEKTVAPDMSPSSPQEQTFLDNMGNPYLNRRFWSPTKDQISSVGKTLSEELNKYYHDKLGETINNQTSSPRSKSPPLNTRPSSRKKKTVSFDTQPSPRKKKSSKVSLSSSSQEMDLSVDNT